MKRYLTLTVLLPAMLCLSACSSLGYFGASASIGEAARFAYDTLQGRVKDVELVFRKGFDHSSVKNLKSVAFVITDNQGDIEASGAAATFENNLMKEFLHLGMQVEEVTLNKGHFNDYGYGSVNGAVIDGARKAGLDALFVGSVESRRNTSLGFFGFGAEEKRGLQATTLKLIDVKSKKIILVVSTDYKRPRASKDVAQDIASVFKT